MEQTLLVFSSITIYNQCTCQVTCRQGNSFEFEFYRRLIRLHVNKVISCCSFFSSVPDSCSFSLHLEDDEANGINQSEELDQTPLLQTPILFINRNDLSICCAQFARVTLARHTMGRAAYELQAPLYRVHKTTGNAAGEYPETPPLLHRPPDDTDGAKPNKDEAPFVQRGTPFQKPFMQQIEEIWPRNAARLLFY